VVLRKRKYAIARREKKKTRNKKGKKGNTLRGLTTSEDGYKKNGRDRKRGIRLRREKTARAKGETGRGKGKEVSDFGVPENQTHPKDGPRA